MQQNLYRIQQQHLQLLYQIEENGGELTEEIEQQLSLTNVQFQEQAVSFGFIVKNYEDMESLIDKEITRLTGLLARTRHHKELFKQRLSDAMQQFGVEKIETPTLKLSFRKSEVVEIDDEDLIPLGLKTIKTEASPSKTAIKEAFKAGMNVPGARLVTKQNLQIR